MAKNPYSNIPQAGSPTNTEAWALIESARRLTESVSHESAAGAMRDALRLNWRLWTFFQADLSANEDFPIEIRSNILSLCQFIDKYTVQALIDPQPRQIETLVNINRNIAAGLLAGHQAAAPESVAAAASVPESSVA